MSLVNVTSGCAGGLFGTHRKRRDEPGHAGDEQHGAGDESPAEMLSNRHFTLSLDSSIIEGPASPADPLT